MSTKVEITLYDGHHLTIESGLTTVHIYSIADIRLRTAGSSDETKLTPKELVALLSPSAPRAARSTKEEAMALLRQIAKKVGA